MLTSKLVRILAIVVAGAVALAPGGARADQRQDLQQRGEQQAKDGRYADAIDSFKQADKIQPRASHACLISLAYTRRELWSQAQLWMATCHQRATPSDPLPDWVPLAEKQIKERLQTANVAEVTIDVKPAGARAKFWVSSFAPDEMFEPRTITLPFGTHVIFAKLDGSDEAPKQHTLQITDKSPQRVEIDFDAVDVRPPSGGDVTPVPVGPQPEQPGAPNNTLSNALLIGGGVALLGGGVAHLLMGRARSNLEEARTTGDLTKYRAWEPAFDRWKPIAITLYVVGGGAAISGYLIRKKYGSEAPSVSATPLPEGGGLVSVGWMR